MYGKYRFSYSFSFPQWDAAAQERASAYWATRRFACRAEGAQALAGKRGSLLGNLTSYDMTRVLCTLLVAPDDLGRLHCYLDVNGIGQDMTEWNLADFKLELLLFRRHLLGLPEPEGLARFRHESRRAALTWTLTLMAGGRHLPQEWHRLLRELTQDTEQPLYQKIA